MPVDLVRVQSRRSQSGWKKVFQAKLYGIRLFVLTIAARILSSRSRVDFAFHWCSPCPVGECVCRWGFFMQAAGRFQNLRRQMVRWHMRPRWRWLAAFIFPLVAVVLWQVIVLLRLYPEFIVPPPSAVLEKFGQVLADGRLAYHARVTLGQTLAGLAIGVICGLVLGYAIAKSQLLDALISPVVITFQSTPVVAYAPLLVIWFGSGPTSKIVTSALIVFFPMLMNTIVGLRTVSPSLRDLMRSLRATHWQMFMHLEIPAAMPVLLGGLKVSATLAVIGAVVGEFVNANAGLGFWINLARNQFDTPLVFVAVLTLALIARALYEVVAWLERRLLHWQHRAGHSAGN